MNFKEILKNYLNKSGVISGDDLSKYTSSSLLAPEIKLIMPDKCDLCTIGVGTSMQFTDGIWVEFHHLHDKYYEMDVGLRHLRLCEWCFDDMQKRENKSQYLSNLKRKR